MNLSQTAYTYARLGLILSLLATGTARADEHSETDRIVDLLRTYESFGNASDAEGMGSLYTEDAVLLPDRFDAYKGAEAITAFYTFAFSALTLDLVFEIDPEDIVVSGDAAYAVTTSAGTRLILETGQTVPEINRELWVFEQVAGDWMIARYAFNKSE
ncbi:MAG: SgcJ/EcaC family oxidoreductase [Pseudomonadota bacterium]